MHQILHLHNVNNSPTVLVFLFVYLFEMVLEGKKKERWVQHIQRETKQSEIRRSVCSRYPQCDFIYHTWRGPHDELKHMRPQA